jgi:hypothetical protein
MPFPEADRSGERDRRLWTPGPEASTLASEVVVMTMGVKSSTTPDERRDFPKGRLDVVTLPGLSFATATFEPGWRWTESLKDIAGTDTCQVHHNGLLVSGRLHIRMDDGEEADLNPGDVFVLSPGHDAWVVGDEPCVAYDFAGQMGETYGKAPT